MTDLMAELKNFEPQHAFCIGVDSDGCAFDVMDLKHDECFCPAFIQHFNLQPVAKAARQVWSFVNLYSKTRGTNRFMALRLALELLTTHPDVQTRGFEVCQPADLYHWLDTETKLGNATLEAALNAKPSPGLQTAMDWTRDVNQRVKAMVHNIGPFPGVRHGLEKAAQHADVLVISQAPRQTLNHEWQANGFMEYVTCVAGQEVGPKAAQLNAGCRDKYDKKHVLMLGDAPGDRDAAFDNGYRFFPIIPGDEHASWERFTCQALPHFIAGQFDDDYQEQVLKPFDRALPTQPPWQDTAGNL